MKTNTIVVIVQCAVALERCSGFSCSQAFYERGDFFSGYRDAMCIPISCGGCPGKRSSRLISHIIKKARKMGLNKEDITVHLASCIIKDSAHYPACPFKEYIRSIMTVKGLKVIEGTYKHKHFQKEKNTAVLTS